MKLNILMATAEAIISREDSFPECELARIGILQYALERVAMKAYSRKLITSDKSREVIKIYDEESNLFVARPLLPLNDEDEVDIDEGLVFAVIEFMASFLSLEKHVYHEQKALGMITDYNNSIESIDFGVNIS